VTHRPAASNSRVLARAVAAAVHQEYMLSSGARFARHTKSLVCISMTHGPTPTEDYTELYLPLITITLGLGVPHTRTYLEVGGKSMPVRSPI
jgi:hypothetical protein